MLRSPKGEGTGPETCLQLQSWPKTMRSRCESALGAGVRCDENPSKECAVEIKILIFLKIPKNQEKISKIRPKLWSEMCSVCTLHVQTPPETHLRPKITQFQQPKPLFLLKFQKRPCDREKKHLFSVNSQVLCLFWDCSINKLIYRWLFIRRFVQVLFQCCNLMRNSVRSSKNVSKNVQFQNFQVSREGSSPVKSHILVWHLNLIIFLQILVIFNQILQFMA